MKILFIILGAFLAFHLFKFFLYYIKSSNNDAKFLQKSSLDKQLSILLNELNQYAYNGQGQITNTSPTSLNLFKQNSSYIIHFVLSGGTIQVQWKTTVLGREYVLKVDLDNALDITDEAQRKTAKFLIERYEIEIADFKNKMR